MRKLFSATACAALIAFLSLNIEAGGTGNGSAFDNRSLGGLDLSAVQVQAPAAPAEAPADLPAWLASGNDLKHAPTPEQARESALRNAALRRSSKSSDEDARLKYRPYADFEETGYLLMNAGFNFNSLQAKREMAKALPADATLVLFWGDMTPAEKKKLLSQYDGVISRDRIKVIALPKGERGFWARDGLPVPMIDKDNKLTLIDAQYYHGFEADKEVSKIFHAGYAKHEYGFEGGNFQANTRGDCVIVNNDRHDKIPAGIFSGYYGCKQLIRLPFIDGIGHVDERVRFINDTTLVTDTPGYKDTLEGKGFTVHLLPRPAKPLETYVNSLIMNGQVVVPVFKQPTDAQALAVYESLGLKAAGGDSIALSNDGMGSVHCITMTYPKVPMADLLKSLGAKEI